MRRARAGHSLAVLVLAVALLSACAGDEQPQDQLAMGRQAFETHCISCHGPAGAGTEQGPPLVHVIYEPGHHSDDAFRSAVATGVAPHHWDFGPMPPVPGIDDDELDAVIAYIRDLQRDAGIQ